MNKKMGTVEEDVGEPQLISEEGPQEVEDCDDTDALVMAAMQGNVEAVEVLLETGVDINHKDSIGVCPLHWAAFCGHSEVARRLLLAKADLHIKDREGRTPLHVASYERSEGQTEVLRTLISKFPTGDYLGRYADEELSDAEDEDEDAALMEQARGRRKGKKRRGGGGGRLDDEDRSEDEDEGDDLDGFISAAVEFLG